VNGSSSGWEAVIGLEIHAQLQTQTKIFCGCSTAFGAPPNSHVCPVCLGLPGALPVLNRRAVDFAIKAALALGCEVQRESVFARKNYFYPDLPKGYQISQYERPLALGGGLEISVGRDPHNSPSVGRDPQSGPGTKFVRLTRIHMEEDAGKSLHEGFYDSDRHTYLDFNRSGVPLIEIVSEPDMRSAEEASLFFSKLRSILVWLGVNDGNMEEGSLRCDANVSVRPQGQQKFGTKAEVKNVNSFRYLQKAIEFEIDRQIDVLENGGRVVQETRLWDSSTGKTTSMRSKEEAHDYRYFPEPDLPPLVVDAARVDAVRGTMPELPEARRRRFVAVYAIPDYDAGVLTQSAALADYFEAVATASGNPKAASNWVMGELLRTLKDRDLDVSQVPLTPHALAGLVRLVDQATISSSVAKEVFAKMFESGRSAEEIVQGEGLAQTSDESALLAIVRDVLTRNADAIAQVRAGRNNAFGFLVGQAMKASRGKGNPKIINELLRRELGT
jgi:aspartyl-tRNA(Asn)/glutamyl-tRNA(Gln) amidotransferase subunit B